MSSFKERILGNFQLYNEWYASQTSTIEDIGLICLPEGEKSYTQPNSNMNFLLDLINISTLMNTETVQ